jgi:hypothetical protein
MMQSVLVKNQKKEIEPKFYTEKGTQYRITPTIRYDDSCGNGHNSFSIIGTIDRKSKNGAWVDYSGGCIHEDIIKRFPELSHLIKWHLCSSNEPMYYVANTVYHAGNRDFNAARKTAIWTEATEFTERRINSAFAGTFTRANE